MKKNENTVPKELPVYTQYDSDYLRAMRDDIITRVNNHTKFVMQKIVSITGALAIVMSNNILKDESATSLTPIFVLLLLPAIAFIYDAMIANNVSSIHKMGCFIKYKIESKFGNMWENFLGQGERKSRCFGALDVCVLFFFDLTLLICCWGGSCYMIWDYFGRKLCYWMLIPCVVFLVYAFILLFNILPITWARICAKYDSEGNTIFSDDLPQSRVKTRQILKKIHSLIVKYKF